MEVELRFHKGRKEGRHRKDSVVAVAVDRMAEAEHHKEELLQAEEEIQSHLEVQKEAKTTKSRKQTDRKDSTCFSTVTRSLARSYVRQD